MGKYWYCISCIAKSVVENKIKPSNSIYEIGCFDYNGVCKICDKKTNVFKRIELDRFVDNK